MQKSDYVVWVLGMAVQLVHHFRWRSLRSSPSLAKLAEDSREAEAVHFSYHNYGMTKHPTQKQCTKCYNKKRKA
jgi:hypothetical protein